MCPKQVILWDFRLCVRALYATAKNASMGTSRAPRVAAKHVAGIQRAVPAKNAPAIPSPAVPSPVAVCLTDDYGLDYAVDITD